MSTTNAQLTTNNSQPQTNGNGIPASQGENSWGQILSSIAYTTLPLVSIYKPTCLPLSVTVGGLHTFDSLHHLVNKAFSKDATWTGIAFSTTQTAVSVASFAGTFFSPSLGIIVSTGNNIVLKLAVMREHYQASNYKGMAQDCTGIASDALYLALIFNGGLDATIASLAVKILTGISPTSEQFGIGSYIESASQMLMKMATSKRSEEEVKGLQRTRYQTNVNDDEVKAIEEIATKEEKATSEEKVEEKVADKTAVEKKIPSESIVKPAVTESKGVVSKPKVRNGFARAAEKVSIVTVNGVKCHEATYEGGIRVRTQLEGPLKGCQTITLNGQIVSFSSEVEWREGGRFVHNYPKFGRIFSEPTKQMMPQREVTPPKAKL